MDESRRSTVTQTVIKWIFICGMLTVIGGAIFYAFRTVSPKTEMIYLNKTMLRAEIANDEESQRKGLSGRLGIDENYAMLFVFDHNDHHKMWMKDMKFSVDMIWINDKKRVVYVKHSVKPDAEPYEKYAPPVPAKYVLEVKAGVAKPASATVGSLVKFDLEEDK